MKKKVKYQICDFKEDSIAVDWNNLPEELINKIDPGLLYNVLSYSKENNITEKTILCLKEVENFENVKDTLEVDNIIFGII